MRPRNLFGLAVLLALVTLAVTSCGLVRPPQLFQMQDSWTPPASCLERAEEDPGGCYRCRFSTDSGEWTWHAVGVVMVRPDSTVDACPVPSGQLTPPGDLPG